MMSNNYTIKTGSFVISYKKGTLKRLFKLKNTTSQRTFTNRSDFSYYYYYFIINTAFHSILFLFKL